MSHFTNLLNRNNSKPPRVLCLPDGYFREENNAPAPGNRIGVRRLSVGDVTRCVAEAKDAERDFGEDYETALMVNVVATALTMPDNVGTPYFKAPDLQTRRSFTPQGVKYLYDVVEALHAETNALFEPSTDADIDRLYALLKKPETWAHLGAKAAKVRRLLTLVADYVGSNL